jgi:hypothetical protein
VCSASRSLLGFRARRTDEGEARDVAAMGGMDAAGLWVSLGASRRGERASRQAGRRGGVGGHGMAATHLRARLPGEDDRRGGGLGWLAGPGGDELGQKLGKSFSFFSV